MDPALRASLVAGAVAGLVGLLAFTLLHVLLVAPLWMFLVVGFVPALLGGAAVGWAYFELRTRWPPGARGGALFGALLWFTLLPLEMLAVLRGPIAGADPMSAMRHIPPEVVLAPLLGTLAGFALTRRARPALALGLAALLLALPVSGTLVALGASRLGPGIFGGLLVVDVAAGLALGALQPRLAARFAPPRSGTA